MPQREADKGLSLHTFIRHPEAYVLVPLALLVSGCDANTQHPNANATFSPYSQAHSTETKGISIINLPPELSFYSKYPIYGRIPTSTTDYFIFTPDLTIQLSEIDSSQAAVKVLENSLSDQPIEYTRNGVKSTLSISQRPSREKVMLFIPSDFPTPPDITPPIPVWTSEGTTLHYEDGLEASFIRYLKDNPQGGAGISSPRDSVILAMMTETCQQNIVAKAVSGDLKNSDQQITQELVCNSYGNAMYLASRGYTYDQYSSFMTNAEFTIGADNYPSI